METTTQFFPCQYMRKRKRVDRAETIQRDNGITKSPYSIMGFEKRTVISNRPIMNKYIPASQPIRRKRTGKI